MNIVSHQFGHDANTTLLRGQQDTKNVDIVIESERLTGEKHARGRRNVPFNMQYLKNSGRLKDDGYYEVLVDSNQLKAEEDAGVRDRIHRGGFVEKIGDSYIACHHASHAAAAVYQSQFDNCAILAFDGYGICCGTQSYLYENGHMIELGQKDQFLMGWRYGLFGKFVREIDKRTDLNDLAGKVMGLYAYGDVKEKYVDYFYEWFKKGYGNYIGSFGAGPFFKDLIPGGVSPGQYSVKDQEFLDLISSMQAAFEKTVVEEVGKLSRYSHNVILTGGCALNVLANEQARLAHPHVNLFVPPNCSDCGLSLGGAVLLHSKLTGCPLHIHTDKLTPFMGLPLLDDENKLVLPAGITRKRLHEVNLARKLSRGDIIGVITGQSEIGPRALGNRSILCSPVSYAMKDILNAKVKHREWWRPFAPVVVEDEYETYFNMAGKSPFMLFAGQTKSDYRDELQAITHVDGTARVQTVDEDSWLYYVLKEFKKITGVPVLLNTSFNDGGKPLVNSYKEAVGMLQKTQMDAVATDQYLYEKA